MSPPSRTKVLLVVALLAATLAPPLALPSAAAAATPVEALRNGSLEGAPGPDSGFTLEHEGAELAVVARDGVQSVNLARSGAATQPSGALGLVRLTLAHTTELRQVVSFAYSHSVPRAPGASIRLEEHLVLDRDGDGAADGCLVRTGRDLVLNSGWVRTTFDDGTSYSPRGGDCTGTGANRTLGALKADPAWREARILDVAIQTVTAEATWGVAPVYVDIATLLATSSPRVRIQDPLHNLCDGASFAAIPEALDCATDGATLLVAPGTYTGSLTLTRAVTLCATSNGGASCEDGRTDVVLRGSGPTVLTLAGDDVAVRGFVLENPGYTATDQLSGAALSPTLVVVTGDRATLQANELRAAASTLTLAQSRSLAIGIDARAGADGIRILANRFTGLGSAEGPDGTCANAPCRVYAIRIDNAVGGEIRDNDVDLTGARHAHAVAASGRFLVVDGNDVLVPRTTSSSPNVGILVNDARDSYVGNNTVDTAGSGRVEYGIRGLRFNGTVVGNVVTDAGEAIGIANARAAPLSVLDNTIAGSLTGIRMSGNGTLARNAITGATDAFLLAGRAARDLELRDNRVRDATTLLRLSDNLADAAVDARENDWGIYDYQDIVARVVDQGVGNAYDVTCYVDADGATRICPPTAAFSWSPETPSWGREVRFADESLSGGRALASWSWTFGDGNASAQATPSHAFALPGSYDVTLTVTDADGTAAKLTRTITVVNRVPVLAPIGPYAVAENQTLTFNVTATDADGDALALTAPALPSGATFDAPNGTLSWKPAFTQAGNHTLTFAASDALSTSTLDVLVAVADTNAPPYIFPVGDKIVAEGQELVFTVRATDPDPQRIFLDIVVDPQGSSFIDHANGTATFRWTPTLTQAGAYPLKVEARDGKLEVREFITIVVTDTDRPPVLSPIPNATVQETFEIIFLVSATDPDGDNLTFGAPALPAGATFDPVRKRFRWTPSYEQEGLHRVVFNVTDGNLTVEGETWITVTKRNRAPFFHHTSPQQAQANRTWLFQVSGGDPDGDPVQFGMENLPENATFNNGTRVFQWRPSIDQVGVTELRFTVTDGSASSILVVPFTVLPNLGPNITLAVPERAESLQPVALSANGTTDPEGRAVTSYQWDFDPTDGFHPQASGIWIFHTFTTAGKHNVTLRAQDLDGFVSFQTVEIEVDDALVLDLEVLEASGDLGTSTLARATLRLTNGTTVGNQTLRLVSSYQPTKQSPPQSMQEFFVRLGPDGTATFVIPRDMPLFNLPGRHVLEGHAHVETSRNDDAESTMTRVEYGILL